MRRLRLVSGACNSISKGEKRKTKPNLSILALLCFIISFIVSRTFTTFFPRTVITSHGLHIHHFWYGLALLAIGGWLGISYEDERISRVAAILFGAGGGMIGDEAGLLLTLGNYWTNLTYTIVIIFLALALVLILLSRYSTAIREEFSGFLRSNASLFIGVFLLVVSIPLIMRTDNIVIVVVSSVLAVVALMILLAYFTQRIMTRKS
jgi:tellurite resistance protein TehA-like permease